MAVGFLPPPAPAYEGGAASQVSVADTVQHYLGLCIYPTAIFLAERLYAEQPTDRNLLLLATCYVRAGDTKAACSVLQSSTAPENRYLYAYCCLELDKLMEAEMALLAEVPEVRDKGPSKTRELLLTTTPVCKVPYGAAGLHLLGRVCQRGSRRDHAIEYYKLSLQLESSLWSSFEALCALDPNLQASDFFGPSLPPATPNATRGDQDASSFFLGGRAAGGVAPSPFFSTPRSASHPPSHPPHPDPAGPPAFPHSAFRTPHLAGQDHLTAAASSPSLSAPGPPMDISHEPPLLPRANSLFTPSPLGAPPTHGGTTGGTGQALVPPPSFVLNTPMASPMPTPPMPTQAHQRGAGVDAHGRGGVLTRQQQRSSTGVGRGGFGRSTQSSLLSSTSLGDREGQGALGRTTRSRASARTSAPTQQAPTRRKGSGGALGGRGSATSGAEDGDTHGASAADLLLMPPPSRPPQAPDSSARAFGTKELLPLLSTLGTAYQLLCQYQCRRALEVLRCLSPQQFYTGWVQHCVGRAYFEVADYPKAKQALETMQQVQPYRVAGLELLSTALWHLKQDVDLSFLAQKVVELDRRSPQCWCVVGNCFSLHKEHETALRFFQRALQLDPHFTYAYTLCGHEYVCNEDFDKAVACFRYAIRIDERHYNAWYGLGIIYYRQEKYALAEYHFTRALSINSQSSVLHCYLGMVLQANDKRDLALHMLDKAAALEPRNPQARFQKANVLMQMQRYEEALEELEKVRNLAPREASVYLRMGKVCKRLGRTTMALRHFVTALDLDPKDSNLVKGAIDRLDEADIDDDDRL